MKPVRPKTEKNRALFSVAQSIDALVEYLVDNEAQDIHSLIMFEVERRIVLNTFKRCAGNKLRAAKLLGIGRNTFQRKLTIFLEDE